MIERLAKMEQRLDSVLPTLCTKADLESVRTDVHRGISEMHRGISEMHRGISEMHRALSDMKKWVIATIFVLLFGIFTVGNFMWTGVRTMVVDARMSEPIAASKP
jgi:hypothetical protein